MCLQSVAEAETWRRGSLSTRGRGQRRMMRRQPTYRVAFDLKRTNESRAHILHRYGCGQIDDLLGVEVTPQLRENLVGNIDRAERHFLGIPERGALGRRKKWILHVVGDPG